MTDKPEKNKKAEEQPEEVEEEAKEDVQPEIEAEQPIEEKVEDAEQPAEESPTEEKTEELVEEPTEEKEKAPVQEVKTETSEKPKKAKEEDKKEKVKKHKDHGEDFKYIVRISNTDVDGEKSVIYGLTMVKGIGLHLAAFVVDKSGVDRNKKVGDLKDGEIEKLQETIDSITDTAPVWMLNHRKEYDTGNDIHLVGPEIDMRLRDEINIMKKIRSYRGIRHERGLAVRGQRTRANKRSGLSLGVSKKRTQV